MPSTDQIIEKTAKRTAKAAAKDAAKQAILEMQFESNEDDGLDLSELDGNASPNDREAAEGFDLFEDVGKVRMERGEVIRYIVKKNGERVGSKFHPYSWDQLSKDFGPGHFQVIARSDSTNQYIKSQTQIVGQAPVHEEYEEESEPRGNGHAGVHWQQPQMGFLEMFNLMQTQSDRARQEATQTATQQAQSQVAMITAMTEMMKNAQLQSQQMFMEMTKMNAQMAEKMAQAQEKIVEKINSRMDKLADVATKKPEGPSWIDVMKMNNESQNKGFELFEKIMKLAELKADEKVDLLESAREVSGGGEGEKKKSLTDTLIESLLPAIAMSMTGQQGQQLAMQQQQMMLQQGRQVPPQGLPQIPQQRRSIHPPRTAQAPQTNRPVQRGQGTPKAPHQATNAPKAEAGKKASSSIIASNGPSISQTILRPATITKPVEAKPVVSPVKEVKSLADKVEVIETPSDNQAEVLDIQTEVKAHCKEILPVFLGGLMLEATEIPLAATKTIEFLDEHGISRDLFLKNVEVQDLIDVAEEYELPKEAHQWLNDLYAYIQTKPRSTIGRKSSPSTEHGTAARG